MGSWSRYLFLSILLFIPEGGCTHKSSDSPHSTSSTEQTKKTGQPLFEMIEQGSPPLKTLRYKLSAMKTQSVEMLMDMSVGAQAGGSDVQPPQDLPPISIVISITPRHITQDGNLPYDFKVVSTKVTGDQDDESDMAQGMKAELGRLRGLSGSAEVSARGVTNKVDIHLPAKDSDRNELLNRMKEEIIGMSIPLPQQPVGKGARWKVTRSVNSGSINMLQIATYTLSRLDDTSMKIDVDFEQNASPQPLDSSNLAGASARLVSLHSDGGGSSVIDFSSLVPLANAFSHTNVVMEIRAHGNQQRVTTTLDLKMTMRPVDKHQKNTGNSP